MPRSLILEPTRELAAQVAENFEIYGKYHKLSMALLIGGTMMDEQIRNLDRGVDVVIATPGRMLDLHERGKIMLNDIKIFVIDEADRMLDMGFIPDVEKIAGLLPPMKQTLFFSATMPPEIRKLADRFLTNPKTVTVSAPATTAENVKQIFIMLDLDDDWSKREALRLILKRESVQNAFIFCNRKRDVATLYKSLLRHGLNAGALHGDMEQSERTATLDKFKRGEITILVCSDVAARGLDVEAMSHVFNFDVPFHADDYVHRIGRTGRAGRTGTAYTLVTPEDFKQVDAIESLIKKKVEREVLKDLPEPKPHAKPQHHRHGHDRRDQRRPYGERRHHAAETHKTHETQPAARSHGEGGHAKKETKHPRQHQATHAKPRHNPPPQSNSDKFDDDLPAFLRRPAAKVSKTSA
jgi:superfamily II DNA/RNA helicase